MKRAEGEREISAATWLKTFLPALVFALLFAWTTLRFEDIAALLSPLVSDKGLFVERESLWNLALQHLVMVLSTQVASAVVAFPLALAVSRESARSSREFLLKAASFGETFPTVALMALLVGSIGYGFWPVAIALLLYGLLPLLRNTISGLQGTAREIVDAAYGSGMDESQVLWRVRLPLALPLVLQGLRVSLVVNVATATLGATVGAGGFGVPIVSGLRSFDALLILKGSIPVALLALFFDAALRAMESVFARRFSSGS